MSFILSRLLLKFFRIISFFSKKAIDFIHVWIYNKPHRGETMAKVNIQKLLAVCVCIMFIVSLGGCIKFRIDMSKLKKTQASTQTTTTTTTTTTKAGPKATDKLVALTFDDGPYTPVDTKLYEVFEKYDIVATFYVVGNRCEEYSDSLKKMNDLGCEIGSHTYSHQNLAKVSVDEIKSQMSKSADVIYNITGQKIKTMRPPEGATNDTVKSTVTYPMILWDVDSLDWKYRNADREYNQIMETVQDGSIILMHDLYEATAEAVSRVVPKLISEGYTFVTVSDLMEIRGVKPEGGKVYTEIRQPVEETTTEVTSVSSTVSSTSERDSYDTED